jgi:hypothetical protein
MTSILKQKDYRHIHQTIMFIYHIYQSIIVFISIHHIYFIYHHIYLFIHHIYPSYLFIIYVYHIYLSYLSYFSHNYNDCCLHLYSYCRVVTLISIWNILLFFCIKNMYCIWLNKANHEKQWRNVLIGKNCSIFIILLSYYYQ